MKAHSYHRGLESRSYYRKGGATRVFAASHSPVFHADKHCTELDDAPDVRQYPLGWVVTQQSHPSKPCSRCTLDVEQTIHVATTYDGVGREEIVDSLGSNRAAVTDGGIDQ